MPISERFIDNPILSVNRHGIVAAAFDTRGIAGIMDLAIKNRVTTTRTTLSSVRHIKHVSRCQNSAG
jgi:hypothetical protein